jgi:hypothetical protein
MSESSWDVFISHAREDKAAVAKPLAEALSRAGLRVWLDEQEISLGDVIARLSTVSPVRRKSTQALLRTLKATNKP